jgi:AcrR family transcriptional regulator
LNVFDEVPTEGQRAQQKRETAEAILEAARAQFEEVGFEKANLRAIGDRAGVSAGTIVHHFGSKQELLHAAFFADLDAVLRRALKRPGKPPLERQLAKLTKAVFGYYRERPGLSRTLLEKSLFAAPPWQERFAGQLAGVHRRVLALTTEAAERGELREDVDAERVAAAYLSFYYFALLGWAQGALVEPERLVVGLLDQHLEGQRP